MSTTLLLLLSLTFFIEITIIDLIVRKNTTPPQPSYTQISQNEPDTAILPGVKGEYDVILKLNPKGSCTYNEQGACLRDVYLKDKNSGNETYFLTEENLLGEWSFVHLKKSWGYNRPE